MDISKFKISGLGTELNPIPINCFLALHKIDIPNSFHKALKLLCAIEGHLDGTVEISRIIVPYNMPYDLRTSHKTVFEKHSKDFIAIISKHNWVAIDISALANVADNVDELCQQGQHFTQGTDHCVNCGTPVNDFVSNAAQKIHLRDRMHDAIPEILPAKISENKLFDEFVREQRLTISDFAKINLKRCDAPKPQGFGGHKDWEPDNWTNAVCGEAGEAANKAKKFAQRTEDCRTVKEYIQFCETVEGQDMLRGIAVELADTIIYSLIAIQKFGFDPAEILIKTFNDVSLREHMPCM